MRLQIPFFNRNGKNGTGSAPIPGQMPGQMPGQRDNPQIAVIPNVAKKKKTPELTQSAKESQSRDIRPEDIENPDELLDGIDFDIEVGRPGTNNASQQKQEAERARIVSDVMATFKRAAIARQYREEAWYTAAAFERGNQWVEYDDSSRQLRQIWRDPDARRYYKTINIIGKLVKQNTARLMSGSPDMDFVPIDGSSSLDRLSAKQRRQVWHHTQNRVKWARTKEDGVHWMQCFPGFFKVTWDAEAYDDVPKFEIVEPGDDAAADIGSDDDPQAMGLDSSGNPLPQGGQPGQAQPQGPQTEPSPLESPVTPMGQAFAQGLQQAAAQQQMQARTGGQAQGQGEVPDAEQSEPGGQDQAPTDASPEPITALPKMLKIVGSVSAQVGLPRIEYVPGFDVYPDPDARDWDELRYVFHARRVPLSELQKIFGHPAYLVNPDKETGAGYESSAIDVRLSGITGDNRATIGGGDYATLYERYEPPSPKYEKGRYTAIANGKLLSHKKLDANEDGEVKYPNPLVPCGYTKEVHSIWYRGIVNDMIDSQVAYNTAKSHLLSRLRMDKLTVVYEAGSGITPDAFVSGLDYRKVSYKKGNTPPVVTAPPADWDKYLLVMNSSKEEMEDMIGLHDNTSGQQEPGTQSGVAIWRLQQADNSIIRTVVNGIEAAELGVVERVIWGWELFGSQPRLIGIDDEAPEQIPMSRLFLPDLMKAGRARAEVTSGSAMPESPGAEEAQLEEWYRMGLFGTPGTPEAAENFLMAIPSLKSSKIVDRTAQNLYKAQARAMQGQMAVQQQQMQLKQQELTLQTQQKLAIIQAQGQQDAALQAQKYQLEDQMIPKGARQATPEEEQTARVNADLIIGKFNAEKEAAAAQQNAALEVGKSAAIESVKHTHALTEAEQAHQHDLEKTQQEHAHDLTQTAVQGSQASEMQDKTLAAQQETAKMNAAAKAKQASTKK